MHKEFLAQAGMSSDFAAQMIIYLAVAIGIFLIGIYIFRSIFNIPSFLRYQRAQIRLLEEIAKKQGVDDAKVQNIISESVGWEGSYNK
ncbi:MAG TPA: hypothetical protein VK671_01075 [Mucilaginibacter sp.]|jgi:hypothetical protein|nr:hypothetical protein [Mucilaginibacter sp.]